MTRSAAVCFVGLLALRCNCTTGVIDPDGGMDDDGGAPHDGGFDAGCHAAAANVDDGGVDAIVDPAPVGIGCWSSPEPLTAEDGLYDALDIAVDGQEVTWAAFATASAPSVVSDDIFVRRKSADAGFGPAEALQLDGGSVGELSLRANAHGVVVAVWRENVFAANDDRIRVARYEPGCGWQIPQTIASLVPPDALDDGPFAGIDDDGNVTVAWTGLAQSPSLRIRRYDARVGRWGSTQVFDTIQTPSLAVSAAGEALVLFGGDSDLRLAVLSDGGFTEHPLPTPDSTRHGILALGAGGTRMIAFEMGPRFDAGIFTMQSVAGGEWTMPERLPDPDGGRLGAPLSLAVDGQGRAVLVMAGELATMNVGLGAVFDHGSWSQPTVLALGNTVVPIAMTNTGIGTIAWQPPRMMAARISNSPFQIQPPLPIDLDGGWFTSNPRVAVSRRGTRWLISSGNSDGIWGDGVFVSHCP